MSTIQTSSDPILSDPTSVSRRARVVPTLIPSSDSTGSGWCGTGFRPHSSRTPPADPARDRRTHTRHIQRSGTDRDKAASLPSSCPPHRSPPPVEGRLPWETSDTIPHTRCTPSPSPRASIGHDRKKPFRGEPACRRGRRPRCPRRHPADDRLGRGIRRPVLGRAAGPPPAAARPVRRHASLSSSIPISLAESLTR